LSHTIEDGKFELSYYIRPEEYEKNGENLYIWISEGQFVGGEKICKNHVEVYEIKKLPQLELGKRITAYFFDTYTSIYLWDYYNDENKNIKYKIGKVEDIEILRAIKNGEKDGLNRLLEYAKKSTDAKTGIMPVEKSDSITKNLGLIDQGYYYVYFELDTENGKYYPIEDVSLYQALCYTDYNGVYSENLFDYLDEDFKWNLSEEKEDKKDDTESKDPIPDAGKYMIILPIVALIVFGVISYKKYSNYKEIK